MGLGGGEREGECECGGEGECECGGGGEGEGEGEGEGATAVHRQAERGAHAPDLSVTALAQHEAQRAARLRAAPDVALDDARQRRGGERLGAPGLGSG